MDKDDGDGNGCISQNLACQLAMGGYKQKSKERIKSELLGDAPQFVQDARDAFNSPLSGLPSVADAFSALSDKARWMINHGVNIISNAPSFFRSINPVARLVVTPTHYFMSPTAEVPTSTLITNTPTPITPTASMTTTLSPTPSATLIQPVQSTWTPTLSPTPQYRVP